MSEAAVRVERGVDQGSLLGHLQNRVVVVRRVVVLDPGLGLLRDPPDPIVILLRPVAWSSEQRLGALGVCRPQVQYASAPACPSASTGPGRNLYFASIVEQLPTPDPRKAPLLLVSRQRTRHSRCPPGMSIVSTP